MFGKLLDQFDDLDMEKIVEVVNLVWNNKDRFMDLVEKLPDLLESTGDGIESAGASAMKASQFLSGTKEKPGASKISELAAEALESCLDEIAFTANLMEKLGTQLDAVKIPSMNPKFTEVMGFNVITGLDMGELPAIDNAADQLKSGSDRLEKINKNLTEVVGHLKDLGGTLKETGKDLNDVGTKLEKSGGTLKSLTNFKK